MAPNGPNDFEIPGQNLDPKNIIVNITEQKVDPITVTPVLIKFSYQVVDDDKKLTIFPLAVTDADGKPIAAKDIEV